MCLCGALATAFGDLALHPIDTIKTVQQAASVPMSIVQASKLLYGILYIVLYILDIIFYTLYTIYDI